jgi:hypothetical protein
VSNAKFKNLSPAVKAALEALGPKHGIEPLKPADHYIFTKKRFKAAAQAREIDPKAVIRAYVDPTGPMFQRWTTLLSRGLADLRQMGSHEDAAKAAVPKLSGITEEFGDLQFKMRLNVTTPARGGGSVKAQDILEADGAALTRLINRVADTADRATEAVIALREFDNVVIRVLTAREVSTRTGLPVAQVLALWRREGNLCVFPSLDSVILDVPSASESEPTRVFFGERPDFSNLIWLADKGRAETGARGATVQRYALASALFVQPIGGDVFGTQFLLDRDRIVDDWFVDWSSGNWVRSGLADGNDMNARKAEARLRWQTLEDDLDVFYTKGFNRRDPEAIRIVPRTPVDFLAGILTEGMLFLYDWRRVESMVEQATDKKFGDIMSAIRYHSMDTDNLPGGVLMSAVLNVGAASQNTALQDAILLQDPAFPGVLDETRGEVAKRPDDDADGIQRADAKKPAFRNWLVTDVNLELLEDYVETAPYDRSTGDLAQWKGYRGVRTYGWTFKRLMAFYSRVFPDE